MAWPLLTLASLFFIANDFAITDDAMRAVTPIEATALYNVSAVSKAATSSKSMCRANEVPLFHCPVGRKVANLCAGQDSVAYRFGKIGQTPELSIISTPDWSNVRMGTVVGGGGGQETHIRFTRGDFHYMLFEGYPGQYHDAANGPWAGLTVIKGNAGNQIMRHDCVLPAASAGWAEEVGKRTPNPDTLYEEEGSAFDGWF